MDNEFPKMLYKVGSQYEFNNGRFDTLIVESADEQDAAIAEAWYLTTESAKSALETPAPTADIKPKAKAKD